MATTEAMESRERILQGATRLFVSRGYHGISMREIAEAVGISKAALYYHFTDKEALFMAIMRADLDRIASIIASSRAEGAGVREVVGLLVRRLLQSAPDQRGIIRLATQEMPNMGEAARAEFGRLYHSKFVGQIGDILSEGIAAGELASMDVRTATWVLLGMMYPFLYPSAGRDPAPLPGDDVVALMLAIFFDGCTARPAP